MTCQIVVCGQLQMLSLGCNFSDSFTVLATLFHSLGLGDHLAMLKTHVINVSNGILEPLQLFGFVKLGSFDFLFFELV